MRHAFRAIRSMIDVRDAIEVVGFVLISCSAWVIHPAGGLLAAGVSLLFLATYGGRR